MSDYFDHLLKSVFGIFQICLWLLVHCAYLNYVNYTANAVCHFKVKPHRIWKIFTCCYSCCGTVLIQYRFVCLLLSLCAKAAQYFYEQKA